MNNTYPHITENLWKRFQATNFYIEMWSHNYFYFEKRFQTTMAVSSRFMLSNNTTGLTKPCHANNKECRDNLK